MMWKREKNAKKYKTMSIDKLGHFCGYPDYYVSELELDLETRVVRLFENFGQQTSENF